MRDRLSMERWLDDMARDKYVEGSGYMRGQQLRRQRSLRG